MIRHGNTRFSEIGNCHRYLPSTISKSEFNKIMNGSVQMIYYVSGTLTINYRHIVKGVISSTFGTKGLPDIVMFQTM
jgi:hypothetical protein